jgi:hypothetical protein
LEDQVVAISRATGTLTFPANFMLVAAMNPCPCGYYGDPIKERTCSAMMISRYRKPTGDHVGELIDGRMAWRRLPEVPCNALATLSPIATGTQLAVTASIPVKLLIKENRRMNRFKRCWLGLLLLALALAPVGCKKAASTPPALTVEALRNAEYRSEWPKGGVAKLTDGEYQEEIVPGSASKITILMMPDKVAFGDLNGDGVDDAAVILASSGGGSGTFITLEAVINDAGTPKDVASASLGDRVQINSVVIAGGKITVDMITHGPDDPLCCPSVKTTRTFELQSDTLVELQ